MKAAWRIIANGQDVSQDIGASLLSLEIIDEAGHQADKCTLTLADPQAELGDKLKNAGESILNGLSFGFIGRNAEEIAADASSRIAAEADKAKSVAEAAGKANAMSIKDSYVEERKQALQQQVEVAKDKGTLQTIDTTPSTTTTSNTTSSVTMDGMKEGFKEMVTELKGIKQSIMEGGDVYIDGNKAGQALVLASTKMS